MNLLHGIYLVIWLGEQTPGVSFATLAGHISSMMPNVTGVFYKAINGISWQPGSGPKAIHGPAEIEALVNAFAQHNLEVHLWGVPRGLQAADIPVEAQRWIDAGNVTGVQSLHLDIEFGSDYWQGNSTQAQELISLIRNGLPTGFHVGAILDARDGHIGQFSTVFASVEFDSLHPMVYPILFGNFQSIDQHMAESVNNLLPFNKPILPMLQAFCDVGGRPTPAQIGEQATAAWNHGAAAISFFRMGTDICGQDNLPHMGDAEYAAIAALAMPLPPEPAIPPLAPPIFVDPNHPNDVDPEPEPGRIQVTGHVMTVYGELLPATVILWRKGIREEEILGRAEVGENGRYLITIDQSNDPNLALLVRAVDETTGTTVTSNLICNIEPVIFADLYFGDGEFQGASEYDILERQLRAILATEGLDAADLTEEDIENIVCIYDLDRDRVISYAASGRLRQETSIQSEMFYGLIRTGMPQHLQSLLAQDRVVISDALKEASKANIISHTFQDNAAEWVQQLMGTLSQFAFSQPDQEGKFSFGNLMDTTTLSSNHQAALVERYIQFEGSIPDFWQALELDPMFEPAQVEEAQFTLQLGALTNNHVPLVKAIKEKGDIASTRDLLKLTEENWFEMIQSTSANGQIVGIPPDTPGDSEENKQKNFVKIVTAVLENAFPTGALTQGMATDATLIFDGKEDLVSFLNGNSDFELDTTDLDVYLDENPATLDNINDKELFLSRMKGLQRISRLVPKYEQYKAIKPLLEAKIDSAHTIDLIGSGFVDQFAPVMGEAQAHQIYKAAVQKAALAKTAFFNFSPAALYGTPAAILSTDWQQQLPSGPDLPDWRTLFGTLAFCSCEHCRSVYSPAAYLVDIIAFLKNYGINIAPFAPGRRQDIIHIELSCENTNIPLPYIDLVNEVLENRIETPETAYQTGGTAAERRAIPEHRNNAAYQQLLEADYPWSLPFSLPIVESRHYLEHVGVMRHELLDIFWREASTAQQTHLRDLVIATEYLGLTSDQQQMVTTETADSSNTETLLSRWGMPSNSSLATLQDHLGQFPNFQHQSKLTYQEFLELRGTDFILNSGNVNVQFADLDCNIETALLAPPPSTPWLDAVHRFERLRRALNWSMYDLDRTITALQSGEINEELIIQLATVERIRAKLNVPLIEMLAWWAPIDTRDYKPAGGTESKSLYQQRFQNETVFDRETLTVFRLNGSSSELLTPDSELENHWSSLSAVLGITTEEIQIIAVDEMQNLDLNTISYLFRNVSLAKALRFTIQDFMAFKELVNIDPFASPKDALNFVNTSDKILEAGFNVPLLVYLLKHKEKLSQKVSPDEDFIASILNNLRTGLQKVHLETQKPASDPTGEITFSKLALVLEGELLGQAIALIQGDVTHFSEDPETFLAEHLSFLSLSEAVDNLLGPNALDPKTQLKERIEYVVEPLLHYLRRLLSHNFVVRSLAEELDVPLATMQMLLTEQLAAPDETHTTIINVFVEEAFIQSEDPITIAAFKRQFESFLLVWKVSKFISTLVITADELTWLNEHQTNLGLLDFNAIPLQADDNNLQASLFSDLERLIDLILLRDNFPGEKGTLFQLLELALAFDPQSDNATEATTLFIERLHEITNWSMVDLEFLCNINVEPLALTILGNSLPVPHPHLNLTFPDDFVTGHAVKRLQNCIKMAQHFGVSVNTIMHKWLQFSIIPLDSQSIKAAIKSKYDNKQWLSIAQNINDLLREKQRDALVAYLIGNDDFEDVNDIYGHLLLDPEIGACFMTSRIKQAISSVQLFIQRVLLNLENQNLNSKAQEAWKWMKNYRVWEANRKIFLYPENWIEPELRDDKSPFFKELEDELLQNELTMETAENAVRHYLEKVDAVSRLEIAGVYTEEKSDYHRVHVIARTPNTPHVYYCRHWQFPFEWTSWEKVDVDIEGDYLMPVVINDRPHLFWPIITEKSEEDSSLKTLQVQLAWSEYTQSSWSAKRISSDTLVVPAIYASILPPMPIEWLFFNFKQSQTNKIVISCFVFDMIHNNKNIGEYYFKFGEFSYSLKTKIARKKEIKIDRNLPNHFGTPENSKLKMMKFEEVPGSHSLDLRISGSQSPSLGLGISSFSVLPQDKFVLTLRKTPGSFKIAYSKQHHQFYVQSSCFYEDSNKTFLIHPFDLQKSSQLPLNESHPDALQIEMKFPNQIPPESVGQIVPNFTSKMLNGGHLLGVEHLLENASDLEDDEDEGLSLMPLANAPNSAAALALAQDLQISFNPLPIYNPVYVTRFRFYTFYHPYITNFIAKLNVKGVAGLLGNLNLQNKTSGASFFEDRYGDSSFNKPLPYAVLKPYPEETVDFSSAGAYSQYDWEIFCHVPLLIADRLSQDQRFEEAQQWLHYIFNPTDCSDGESPQCYWKFRPFNEYSLDNVSSKPIQELMKLLSEGNPILERQVAAWRDNPFKPHAIARLRYTAYQKNVVMKYLDNLIAWGDELFRRDTIESLNEATQLYILAASILGPRPEEIPASETVPEQTFAMLQEAGLDSFSNVLIEIEYKMTLGQLGEVGMGSVTSSDAPIQSPPPLGTILYFCIPINEKLISYWDVVADRLFKIRHCMNIEGQVRQLPLFEPPIDPAMLVRAVAAGVDISSAINDLFAPLPHYRFQIILQKAIEFCGEVKSLGGMILSLMEKRDAEGLALLRSGHEQMILEAVKLVREKQIDEAEETLQALEKSREMITTRRDYYRDYEKYIDGEKAQLGLMGAAMVSDLVATILQLSAAAVTPTPDFSAGVIAGIAAGTFGFSYLGGGDKGGKGLRTASEVFRILATMADRGANIAGVVSSNQRRWDDVQLQKKLADKELLQIEKQIEAAKIRVQIAENELANHKNQITNSREADAYMRSEFTNQELYNWMISQISTIYFQSYRLAYDLAKQAEQAFQYELFDDSNYIQFGYWDSLKKGLLSGEKLGYDLRRLEAAYLEKNRREYEITKHVSLASINPLALIQLKETGTCEFILSEEHFDFDFAGHYRRRIKSVSLSVPAVTGPYTSVYCTLEQIRSSIRYDSILLNGNEYARIENDDPRFRDSIGTIQSIATSRSQNDSGLFELNFRDERYLPFEGNGVISHWRLNLANEFRQFDYNTITDVIMTIYYTACDGGTALKNAAVSHLQTQINELVNGDDPLGLYQAFDMRHNFPTEWHRFLHPPADQVGNIMTLPVTQEKFPFMFRNRDILIANLDLFIRLANQPDDLDLTGTTATLTHSNGDVLIDLGSGSTGDDVLIDLGSGSTDDESKLIQISVPLDSSIQLGDWILQLTAVAPDLANDSGGLNPEAIDNMIMVLRYLVE